MFRSIVFPSVLLLALSVRGVPVEGRACYRYGDGESLVEARLSAKTLALRDAVEGAAVFLEARSTVADYRLREDLVEALAAGFLTGCAEDTETDREAGSVCCRVSCDVDPADLERFVAGAAAERRSRDALPANDCLRVLALNRAASPDGERQRFTAVLKVLDPGACDAAARALSLVYLDGDGRVAGGATRELPGRLRRGEIIELGFDTRLDVVGALVELAPTPDSGPSSDLPPELEEAIARFFAAVESGDLEARLALLAEDALVLPDHGPPMVGRAEIADRLRKAGGVFRIRDRRVLDRIVDGGLACLSCSYEYDWHAEGEAPRWRLTKNLHVWERSAGGDWRLRTDIWNSDRPPADVREEGAASAEDGRGSAAE